MSQTHYRGRFEFQREYVKGRTLNVGCGDDPAQLQQLGATNVDLLTHNPATGSAQPVDVIADARALPFSKEYNAVILGDILEHMEDDDIVQALTSAAACLRPGGVIAVTFPEDYRPYDLQRGQGPCLQEYTDGISAYHAHPLSHGRFLPLVKAAHLDVRRIITIDYDFGDSGFVHGYGFVLEETR